MITNQPNIDYSIKYRALFDDAISVLHENGEATDVTTFTSLEEYFMHIGDLATLHKNKVSGTVGGIADKTTWNTHFAAYSKFLMLPLDEEYFKINANTRVITVPALFASHGVSLDGDYHAETLLFEIDRYFDFIDLIRTNIFVQWTSPNGVKGSTLVSLVDYDSNKIRFGWTLSDKVIDASGTLTFSIRFIMRNSTDAITYSLNTLSASVKVKPALSKSIEVSPTDEDSWAFANAVVNGANSNTTSYPLMASIYLDLANTDMLLTSNACTFVVGAYPVDTGTLSYKWVYIPYDGTDPQEFAYQGSYYIVTNDSSKQEGHTYYTRSESDGTYTYTEFTGETFAADTTYYEKNAISEIIYEKTSDEKVVEHKYYYALEEGGSYTLVENLEEFETGTDYYEPHAQFTICNSSNPLVAGHYKAEVINTISNNTTVRSSTTANIPATTTLTFSTNLIRSGKDNVLVTSVEGEGEEAVTTKALTLNVVPTTDHASVDVAYQWSKATVEDGSFTDIPNETSASYTATQPGWYKVTAIGSLNRTSVTAESNTARITDVASAPTITSNTGEVTVYALTNNTNRDITITTSIPNDASLDSALVSDNVTYEWQCQEHDVTPAAFKTVEVGKNGVVAVDGAKLTVKYDNDTEIFRCIATNHLNDTVASSISDKYTIILDSND